MILLLWINGCLFDRVTHMIDMIDIHIIPCSLCEYLY